MVCGSVSSERIRFLVVAELEVVRAHVGARHLSSTRSNRERPRQINDQYSNMPDAVEHQPLGGQRQGDDLGRDLCRELDRVVAAAIRHRVNTIALACRSIARISSSGWQISELAEQ